MVSFTGKALLIAEKPDLMRKIQDVYQANKSKIPYQITFVAQRGHLVTLLTPDEMDESLKEWSWETLPIIPEQYGGWKYKVIKEKKTGSFMTAQERFDIIKKELASNQYDFVIHAGDPDQEGELLVNIVLRQLKNRLPVARFWTNDLTEEHILESLIHLRDDKEPQLTNLMDAAYCRQHTDYLIGMNTSRAATLKMGATISSGRVEDVIFAIVCKREYDIQNFKPKTTYGVKTLYKEGFEGTLFAETEEEIEAEEESQEETLTGVIWFDTKEEAENLIAKLGKLATVKSYTAKRQETLAPKLFKLSTAQKAADKLGYSAADTQRIIQSLYEQGYMSYPRTGCEYIHSDEAFEAMLASASVVPELATFVTSIGDNEIRRVRAIKKWVNDKAANEEGHTALVPTTKKPEWSSLSKEEKDIYALITRQFVAIFLPPLVQDKVSIVTEVNGNTFKSNGQTLVSPGYTKVFGKTFLDNELPVHKEGDVLEVENYCVSEKTTTCPKRYTTPDIIAVCENPAKFLDDKSLKRLGKRLKIGTPATRSGIIEKLIKNKYLATKTEAKKAIVYPTEAGLAIYDNIGECKMCKVDLTGECEERLELVRSGKLSKDDFEKAMYLMVRDFVSDIKGRPMKHVSIDGQKQSQYKNIGICPKCQKPLVRGPKMYYCAGYKEGCKVGGLVEKFGAIIEEEEFLNMLLNGQTITKTMQKDAVTWQQKIQCDENGKIVYPNSSSKTSYTCPRCGKPILETETGYACEGKKNKSCDIAIYKSVAGVLIPEEQVKKLFLEGKTDLIQGFYSEKKKKNYDAFLCIDKDAKKIKMEAGTTTQETKFKCPCCGKPLLKQGFMLVCKGSLDNACNYKMYASMYKKDLTDEQIEHMIQLVKEDVIEGGEQAYVTEKEVYTQWRCPCCGNVLKRNGIHFYCQKSCGFEFYRAIAHHILTDEEISSLFVTGKTRVIHDFVNKNGEKYSGYLQLDKAGKRIEMKFENEVKTTSYACPCCKEPLKKDGLKLNCRCGFEAWAYAGDKVIPEDQLNLLFTKGETGYMKLKGKKGWFEAKIVVDRENKKTGYAFKPKKK